MEKIIFGKEEKSQGKIAAFDFDGTLVMQDSDETVFDNCKEKLTELYRGGHTLVIFTNQGGVSKGKVTIEEVKERIHKFLDYVGLPIYVFIATEYNRFRKPHPEMWYEMLKELKIDKTESAFFVGDAAGRVKVGKSKKDFSCSDRKFAYNCGIKFETPEQFFNKNGKDDRRWEWDGFDVTRFTIEKKEFKLSAHAGKEIILLIGPQASGKTTMAKRFCEENKEYVYVNQDTLKTKAKCLKLIRDSLKSNKSIIVDNTNSSEKNRSEILNEVMEKGYWVRYIHFNINKEFAQHLDEMRVELHNTVPIPSIAFIIYFKNLRESSLEQECDELVEYFWQPNSELPKEFFYRY
jgi:bifunctional polynucleotide phosphatase/kinase